MRSIMRLKAALRVAMPDLRKVSRQTMRRSATETDMSEMNHDTMHVEGGRHVKMWTRGVPVEDAAREQLRNTAKMPFIFKHIAVMPDVHLGKGSTVGSVIPTLDAIIPAAVGVDIGCSMIAAKTTLCATDLPDNLSRMRAAIERAVPHGHTPGKHDRGAWGDKPPENADAAWASLLEGFARITAKSYA
jgi:tRNA-splicing ligase RtcB